MFKFAIGTAVMALALCAVVSTAVLAEEVKHEGTIAKIEGATLTVKSTDAQHEMTLGPATKITLDGKPARASDLKVGQKVRCTCNKEGDKSSCSQLDAFSAAQ